MIASDFAAAFPRAHRQARNQALRRLLWDHDTAEDVAQLALIRAWRAMDRIESAEHLGAWASRAARWIAMDKHRERRLEGIPDNAEPSFVIRDGSDLAGFVEAALASVPDDLRPTAVLYYAHGQSIASIAACLGATEEAIKMRLHRARLAMRATMGGA